MKSDQRGGSGNKGHDRRGDVNEGMIIDDIRFATASSHPQFSSRRGGTAVRGRRPHRSSKDNEGGDVDDNHNDDNDNTKKNTSSFDLGLGPSLTRAIESDDRFKSALAADPERFGFVPTRDKYGRKTRDGKQKKKKNKKGSLKKERINDEEGDDDENSGNDADDCNVDVQVGGMEARIAYLNALSRGDISASSSSDDDDVDSDEGESDAEDDSADGKSDNDDSDDEVYGKSGIFDPDHSRLPGSNVDDEDEAALTDEPSRYLCVLNLNWDRVRAVDVFAMLHSFCPPGTLRKVVVYPSDFGRERMERERIEGPPAGIWKKGRGGKLDVDDDDDSASGDESDDTSGSEPPDDERSHDDDDSVQDEDKEGEDAFNLAEATAGLYKHFPPQSTITKNSRLRNEYEGEEGFDVERLREYEASKLRYYFAIATFASSDAAARAYEGVDGMEMEDTAAEIDVRVLPEDAYPETICDRHVRDEWCDSLPAKYVPPEDAQATALRQSRVMCSWEKGDTERERLLTRHGMGKDAWEALAAGDDIGFYLATSDNSSSGDSSDEEDDELKVRGKKKKGMTATSTGKKKRGSSMRAMLGLEGSDSEQEDVGDTHVSDQLEDQKSTDSNSVDDEIDKKGKKTITGEDRVKFPSTESKLESSKEGDIDDSDEDAEANDTSKHKVMFMPGKRDLEGRIRSKLSGGEDSGLQGLSPYEKYLEKRKDKRRERRQAVRNARKKTDQRNDDYHENKHEDDDGMYGVDPEFGVAMFSDEESDDGVVGRNRDGSDGFFVDETSNRGKISKMTVKKHSSVDMNRNAEVCGDDNVASTKEELELLIAGDDDEEHEKDYDMRGLTKLERHSTKKLKGKRKRQLETLAANVTGQGFHIDTSDTRFAALLDGSDDKFGIDRTNPAYKETGAMKELLHAQSKRRNKNFGGRGDKERCVEIKDVHCRDGGWIENSSGAVELSSLVKSIQNKVLGKGAEPKRKKANSAI